MTQKKQTKQKKSPVEVAERLEPSPEQKRFRIPMGPTEPIPKHRSEVCRENFDKRRAAGEAANAAEAAAAAEAKAVAVAAAEEKRQVLQRPVDSIDDYTLRLMTQAISPRDTPSLAHVSQYRDQVLFDAGEPGDPLERMLIDQVAAAHPIIMRLHCCSNAGDIANSKMYHEMAIQLMGELRQMILALKEYRTQSRRPETSTVGQSSLPVQAAKHSAPVGGISAARSLDRPTPVTTPAVASATSLKSSPESNADSSVV